MAEKLGVGSADIEHAVIKSCGTQTPTDAAILEVRKRKIVELLDAVEGSRDEQQAPPAY